jgi:glycerophosphoryl diester phosphodiesterase
MLIRLVAMACIVISAGPVAAEVRFTFFEPVVPARAVQIIAERGLHNTAPENTVAAVLSCGTDYIEWAAVDVRLTKDGQHVILHDATLDRTTNGKGSVVGITRDEFTKLDAGSWYAPRFKGQSPPTLVELLTAARGKVNLCLDCREIDPARLVRDIKDQKMEPQVIVRADPGILSRIHASAKGTIATLATYSPRNADFETWVREVDPSAVELEADDVTANLCRQFHERGIRVEATTVGTPRDRPATWARVIAAGVDWLRTDTPAPVRCAEVRRRIAKFPVQIAHHRGANRYAPENTLPAIYKSVALGADYIEIDIRTTKDGQYVLVHDGNLNRTTGGKGPVRELPAGEIAKLDAGAWFGKPFAETRVPTLDEGLAALGERSAGYLDAKDIPPADLLAAMRKYRLVERSVVYQSAEYLTKLRALEPAVRSMPPLRSAADFEKVAAGKPYAVDANWRILSRELIARAHQAGIRVFSDALGPHESIERYNEAIDWGIDVIQTDYPLRVLRAIELRPAR